jgi:hypothetical protein
MIKFILLINVQLHEGVFIEHRLVICDEEILVNNKIY